MNQRKLKKQLLLQRIATHRGLVQMDLQNLRHDLSPIEQLSGFSGDLSGLLGSLAPVAAAALRRSGAPPWLRYGLTVTLPVAIMVLAWKKPKH